MSDKKPTKKLIKRWIEVLDECVENWEGVVAGSERGFCTACHESHFGQRWIVPKYNNDDCACPLDAERGCCDGKYEDWNDEKTTVTAKRVLAYIKRVRAKLVRMSKVQSKGGKRA